jgi:hypothetical protein
VAWSSGGERTPAARALDDQGHAPSVTRRRTLRTGRSNANRRRTREISVPSTIFISFIANAAPMQWRCPPPNAANSFGADYLEGELGGREFLAGGCFSIAGISTVSPIVNPMHGNAEIDAARWPKLAAYVERSVSRASFKGLIGEEKAQFAG